MGRTSDSRARLIESAIELMYQSGYTAVGVKEVCERAGVNKGSFYYFFPSKQALILAALDAQWEGAKRNLLDVAFAKDIPLPARFLRLFQLAAAASQQGECKSIRGCFFGNLALELSTQDEEVRQKLRDIFQEWAGYFERVLAEAVASGELSGIDPPATARAMLAYFQGVALLAKTHNDLGQVELLAPTIIRLISPTPSPKAASEIGVISNW
jgi:TetR/AcrR family transcriptional repressor of nem operon